MNANDPLSISLHAQPQPSAPAPRPERATADLTETSSQPTTAPPEEPTSPPAPVDEEVLQEAVSSINAMTRDRGLAFNVDESSGRIVVSIVDSKTQEIIRQIPPELTLKLAENMSKKGESIRGLMLNIDI